MAVTLSDLNPCSASLQRLGLRGASQLSVVEALVHAAWSAGDRQSHDLQRGSSHNIQNHACRSYGRIEDAGSHCSAADRLEPRRRSSAVFCEHVCVARLALCRLCAFGNAGRNRRTFGSSLGRGGRESMTEREHGRGHRSRTFTHDAGRSRSSPGR